MQGLLNELAAFAMQHPGWLVGAAALGVPLLVTLVSAALARGAAAPAALPEEPQAGPEAAVAAEAEPAAELAEAAEVEAAPEVAPAPVEAPAEPPPPRPAGPPAPLGERLQRTRETLLGRLGGLLGGRRVDDALIDELEALLLGADLGVRTADSLLADVRKKAAGADADAVRDVLRQSILERLRRVDVDEPVPEAKPHVIVALGVNGSGKTTTIGKLAARHTAAGRKVILGAGDTFRAAAIEQLETWGERVGAAVVGGRAGGDPSAVAFDTVKAAVARGADVAIIDTAGRLQTKRPLMEELGKLVRVIGRELPGAPHETLLVLDANTGQNAISQARLFTEVAGVTGLVLTKLDGTAKGGVVVGLADEFGIPLRYVGVGEAVEDLREFSAEEFVEALFQS
jgi:fused signal recognition particle receptor